MKNLVIALVIAALAALTLWVPNSFPVILNGLFIAVIALVPAVIFWGEKPLEVVFAKAGRSSEKLSALLTQHWVHSLLSMYLAYTVFTNPRLGTLSIVLFVLAQLSAGIIYSRESVARNSYIRKTWGYLNHVKSNTAK